MSRKSPWWLVAGVFLVLAISSGFGFYNLSVYMNALGSERDLAVADLSAATALLFLASGAGGVAVGRLIERYDVRPVMVAGAALGGLALTLIGAATQVWHLWLLYALFGLGNSGVSLVPCTTVVTRWFPGANRAVAISVATTGLSIGGVLLTPACASVVKAVGMATAMPWFGAAYLLAIAPVALVLVRSWPEPSAREHEGAPLARKEPSAGEREGAPLIRKAPAGERPAASSTAAGGVLRQRFFLAVTAAFVGIMASQVGGIAHLFNHVERFAGHLAASAAVIALSLASICGRLLGGWVLATGFPIRLFTMVNIVGQAAGLAALGLAGSKLAAVAGAALFGVSVGNLLMLQPLLLVQAFGPGRYPRIYSIGNAAATVGVAGGPLAMGIVHDAAGYPWAFGLAAALSALALLCFWGAGRLPPAPFEPARRIEIASRR